MRSRNLPDELEKELMNIDDRDEEVYEHKDLTKEPAVFKFYYAWKKFTMDKKVSEEISLILMLFLL